MEVFSTMYGTIVVDICYYTFVKTREMYTKSELQSKPWALDNNEVSVWQMYCFLILIGI